MSMKRNIAAQPSAQIAARSARSMIHANHIQPAAPIETAAPADPATQLKQAAQFGHRLGGFAIEAGDRRPAQNASGLPEQLQSGIERLSGRALGDVNVHYNSPKPAQLQALAYTQGRDIHIARGQERHLAHEAWHVVQQQQGRVQPTMQLQGKGINDDTALEHEADVMGARAVNAQSQHAPHASGCGCAACCGNTASLGHTATPHMVQGTSSITPIQRVCATCGSNDHTTGNCPGAGGSTRATQHLRASMGAAAALIPEHLMPNARPHTATGTGQSGTDHQGRNAYEINKAKQRTMHAMDNPTMFQNSQMRMHNLRHQEKDALATISRDAKKKSQKASTDAAIREYYELRDDETITSAHRKEYKKLQEPD